MDTIKYLKNFIFKSFTYKLYIFFKHKKKYCLLYTSDAADE